MDYSSERVKLSERWDGEQYPNRNGAKTDHRGTLPVVITRTYSNSCELFIGDTENHTTLKLNGQRTKQLIRALLEATGLRIDIS
jgi:hypothetical protein